MLYSEGGADYYPKGTDFLRGDSQQAIHRGPVEVRDGRRHHKVRIERLQVTRQGNRLDVEVKIN